MLQSKQRLLELNANLAETLTDKGITATADETTTSLINKVADITSGDDSVLRGLIQRDLTEIIIPDGVTSIGNYAFGYCSNLTSIILPDSITSVGQQAFENCSKLSSIILPIGVTSIGVAAFRYCRVLTSIRVPSSLTSIASNAFQSCSALTTINLPSSLTSIASSAFRGCSALTTINLPSSLIGFGSSVFYDCPALKEVTLGDEFNCNNVDLSASELIERETIVDCFNALADRTGQTAYKLTIGATNLAKLTEEDILIATNKNWTLA